MGEIKQIDVSIRPEYTSATRGMPTIMRCQIRVKVFGNEIVETQLIPDNDFESRFDWFVQQAVDKIKKELFKENEN
jgi:hypothetical protein